MITCPYCKSTDITPYERDDNVYFQCNRCTKVTKIKVCGGCENKTECFKFKNKENTLPYCFV